MTILPSIIPDGEQLGQRHSLVGTSVAVTDPPAEHDDADLDVSAASDQRPLRPCCAGRMIIVESFGRGGAPAARRRPKTRCHDAHHRLIAPSACQRTPLPALHRSRPAASNRMPYAVDQAEIALSTAAVAPNSPPRSSIRRRLRRPAHSTTQAAASSNPHSTATCHPAPAGSFLGGFRTPPSARADTRATE